MEPLISVIMPVYNVEKYLHRAVQSILDQTIHEWELILVDDGSMDESPQICDYYARQDGRIRVFHQLNGGLSAARNIGLSMASGKYISFVDSDDWIKCDMLQIMSSICEEKRAQICCCEFFIAYDNGRTDERTKTENVLEILNQKEAIYELLIDRKIQSFSCNKLFERELFDGIEFPVGKHYEDIGTTYKLVLKSEKVAIYNVSLYYYYQRENSITHTFQHSMAIVDHYDHLNFRIEMLNVIGERYPEYRAELLHISELAAIKLYNISIFYKDAKKSIRKEYARKATRYLSSIKEEIFTDTEISKSHKMRFGALLYCPPIYRLMLWYTFKKRGNLS